MNWTNKKETMETIAPCGHRVKAKIIQKDGFPDGIVNALLECNCPCIEKCDKIPFIRKFRG